MKNFEYYASTKIYFGDNQIGKLADSIKLYGRRVLLTMGHGSILRNGIFDQISEQLVKNGIHFMVLDQIAPNPDIDSARHGIEMCRNNNLDFILAVGGGSVIDCSKAIAAGYYCDNDPWDFFTGKAKISNALPIGTVLTLSATGSEMNGFMVLSNREKGKKLGSGSELLRPKFSFLNPVFTYSVDKYQTACGTADIMSHCMEQYFSPNTGTMLQDSLTEAILKTCLHYGPIAIAEPENYEARANLMWASSLALNGMLSTGKDGDWATHLIEHELSALTDIAHGAGLAIITPAWMEEILDDNTLLKFVSFAKNVFNVPEFEDQFITAKEGIIKLRMFFNYLGIPSKLSKMDIILKPAEILKIADNLLINSKIGNIKVLSKEAVIRILDSIV